MATIGCSRVDGGHGPTGFPSTSECADLPERKEEREERDLQPNGRNQNIARGNVVLRATPNRSRFFEPASGEPVLRAPGSARDLKRAKTRAQESQAS